MTIRTSYTNARAHLAQLCDTVAEDRDIVIIQRRSAADVALIAADELDGLLETAHLLRSPKNAQRLLTALSRALDGAVEPQTVSILRSDLGLDME